MTDQQLRERERTARTPKWRINNLIRRTKLVSRAFRDGRDPSFQIRRMEEALVLAEEMAVCGHRIIDYECVVGCDGRCS